MTDKDQINTGGAAFPFQERNDDGSHHHSHEGMTLRDYIAAKAMQGDMAAQDAESGYYPNATSDETLIDRAKFFYRFADAMLVARGGSL
ncbi:hypothetical protein HBA92_19715 [Ochrobactrum sp. MR28]|nr:hypothetical protein [Ochrobactrum sp. MR28]MBX8818635.1 hypothetical protein [Ochrobactrum sp. MR31]